MNPNPVLQFEGDFRMSLRADNGDLTPVLADAGDVKGNTPVEANAAVFSYAAGNEIKVVSKRRDRYGNTIFSDQQPGDSTISITLIAVPAAILARMFYGDAADTNINTSTVVAEAVTFSAPALTQPLAKQYVAATPAVVVTSSPVGTTYVEGTDFTINYRAGTITRLAGGSIGAAVEVLVSYSARAYTLTTIRGGSKPLESFYIEADMLNRPDRSDMSLEIYHAKLAVDGDVDLLGDDPITVTLTGSLITPPDKNEPYLVKRYDVAA